MYASRCLWNIHFVCLLRKALSFPSLNLERSFDNLAVLEREKKQEATKITLRL